MNDTWATYAMIVAVASLILNLGTIAALVIMVKSYAEKIALLSHVAGHYLNELEQREAKDKLVKTRRDSIQKVTNTAFFERNAR